ncbi:AfsR/SARP family transcriptional regulator [Bradyrhizobium japonicum]|uniref:AfsR/SARP family transcriptional regulator n=1 Tax=Bradyrhizobium japonicum TaxID=375 RepID=UPI0018AD3B50|nr:bacterial transcriptional activator domain-containing protein [Bradyrhizobium japonicum]
MQVSVEFLGRTRVCAGDKEISVSRQSISFLAYLVLFREIDHPREVLIEQFWSSSEPTRARSCLGTALSRLRNVLKVSGSSCLEFSSRGEPRISVSSQVWFDIVAFETGIAPSLAASPGRLEPALVNGLATALNHYRGDLMLGWYDDWVLVERERLRVLCLRGYRRLMEHYSAARDLENALAAGLSALRIEPLQELVQQHVIELYSVSGQRAAAIRQYDRLAQLLKSELGISPSKATRDLIERIRLDLPLRSSASWAPNSEPT